MSLVSLLGVKLLTVTHNSFIWWWDNVVTAFYYTTTNKSQNEWAFICLQKNEPLFVYKLEL